MDTFLSNVNTALSPQTNGINFNKNTFIPNKPVNMVDPNTVMTVAPQNTTINQTPKTNVVNNIPANAGVAGQGYWSNTGWVSGQPDAQYLQNSGNTLQSLGFNPPSKIDSLNYNIDVPDKIPSNYLNRKATGSLDNAYYDKTQNLTKDTNLYPSDSYLTNYANPQASLANDIYNTSQYSPQEVSALKNFADLQTKINATQLATRRQIKQLQENGLMTKEQAQGFISEEQRRADAQLADLTLAQNAQSNTLDVLGKIRGNQLTAYQNLFSTLKGSEVSPGSTLYNPITGVMYQGSGAAPAQIFQSAQTLKQNDQMTGQLRLTPQGTVDDNYYYNLAQQQLSGGMGGQSYGSMTGGNVGTTGGVPQQVQTYLQASGGQFINDDKVPANQKELVKQLAAQNNVPYLNSGDVDAVRNVQYVKDNLAGMTSVVNNILSPGLLGRAKGLTLNPLKQALQSDTDISTFNSYRDTAIKIIQSLAGGQGSGLRLTTGEIATATSNIPTINDNLETATNKISLLNTFLDTKLKTIFPNQPTGYGPQSSTTTTGSKIINTAVGQVDNSWFQ